MDSTIDKILQTALAAVEPGRVIADTLYLHDGRLIIGTAEFDLSTYRRIHVLAAGKGAVGLFVGLETILTDQLYGGVVVAPGKRQLKRERVQCVYGAHPVPDRHSLEAGRTVCGYIEEHVGPGDLVFFLVTGGASAMMIQPRPGLDVNHKIAVHRLLVASNAEISEINRVRKHLSLLKGGGLAQLVAPAALITLAVSDVVDSPLADIGSGPSIASAEDPAAALAVLKRYDLEDKVPAPVLDFLREESPRNLSPAENHHHFLLADNLTALNAAEDYARRHDIHTHILTSADKGEAREAAKIYAALIKEILRSRHPFTPPVLLLAGGEFTVTLKGSGQGGRNQEFVLAMLKELQHIGDPFYVLSVGSDGIDGPTDAAGAWIDETTAAKAAKQGLDIDDYLARNDAYGFFRRTGNLVETGATGTNVMDLRFFRVGVMPKGTVA